MSIIRGTTPTIKFTFDQINTSDIVTAYLVIKQRGKSVIERDLPTATIETEFISWKLEQAETLKLSKSDAEIICDWKLNDGTRGRSNAVTENVVDSGKLEVI